MPKPKVLVTRAWPEAVEARLKASYEVTLTPGDVIHSAADLRAAAGEYDAILPTVTDRIGAEVLAPGGRLKFIGNYGVGYSHIDTGAAKAAGIVVSNTPDVLSDCTADIAMTLLLMVARRAGEGERFLRAGLWDGWRPGQLIGRKVSGATIGIVGFGRIGQAMAQRAHHGFGMKVQVQNRSPIASEVLAAYGARQVASLDEMLSEVDFLSLHCPGGAANRHLIDARRLSLMRPDAFLINTARGEVVDETALAEALAAGRLAGAGLDVYEEEPKVTEALLTMENVALLPHLGSATRETRDAMGNRAVDNLDAFFAGREPPDRVA
ncbi:MAG TPA: D-glycerate dehydrogenase [Albidovulum sp.]|uniref:2-hydroxyacid dehydrogenase n=1 Tax=Albidovulum sp. TaxID=1872424 RepID=UPI002B6FB79E|nr:D-glycerate dehydrogenase [Albidovulum sp.]